MAIKKVNDASLTSVADAIREKGGTTANLYFPDGFVDAIEAIPTGGDTFADLYLKSPPTLFEYENLDATTINNYAFAQSYIRSVNMPNVEHLGWYAFYNCSALTQISFEKVQLIKTYTFSSCGVLSSVNFPLATEVQISGLRACNRLTTVNLPKVKILGEAAFMSSFLESANVELNLPELQTIGYETFRTANLAKIIMPNVVSIGNNAFYGSKLKEVTIPDTMTTFGSNIFAFCSSLKKVIVEKDLDSIPVNFIQYCNNLEEFDLTHCTQIPTLATITYFNNVPNTCVIKVPAALEAEWKTATNWANFASQIQGV